MRTIGAILIFSVTLAWMIPAGLSADTFPAPLPRKLERLRQAAWRGEVMAQYHLGRRYEQGLGVTQDFVQAAAWYRKAARKGYAPAQSDLGLLYEQGRGLVQDAQRAAFWYLRAASQGNAIAQYNLGNLYAQGHGVVLDYVQAADWYRRAGEQGLAVAQYHLGWLYVRGCGVEADAKEAASWIRRAAEQGYARAEDHLGLLYRQGTGVVQDDQEAVAWYRRAAEQGLASAKVHMGFMVGVGWGVERDEGQSLAWYQRAVERGDASAKLFVSSGMYYPEGIGLSQDDPRSASWLRLAAARGEASARFILALWLDRGHGVPQDARQALVWYRRAAAQGHGEAQVRLGDIYSSQTEWRNDPPIDGYLGYARMGVAKDDPQAAAWYLRAATQGHARGQFKLGMDYLTSKHGAPLDLDRALPWLRRAVARGDAEAQWYLGYMDESGTHYPHGTQNRQRAKLLLTRAAQQGHPKAMSHLAYMLDDPIIAYEWWFKAYRQGLSSAAMAFVWRHGAHGAMPDPDQRAHWEEQAIKMGNLEPYHEAGERYRLGKEVPQDYRQAAIWYLQGVDFWRVRPRNDPQEELLAMLSHQKAQLFRDAREGDALAQFLAGFHGQVEGFDQDDDLTPATLWYRRSAEQGYVYAQHLLGMAYEAGWEVEEEDRQAEFWYRRAGHQGYLLAQIRLDALLKLRFGDRHANGEGMPRDDRQAVDWYRRVAEARGFKGEFKLGQMYAAGRGVEQNQELAAAWYRLAMGSRSMDDWGMDYDPARLAYWALLDAFPEIKKKKRRGKLPEP